jgi:prepilin-type processing-associated H-X9-DG protein
MPFMEQGASFASMNFSIPGDLYPTITAGNHPNFTALYSQVSSYLCPSDTDAAPDQLTVNYTARKQGSYAGNRGTYETLVFNWATGSAYPDPTSPYYSACNYGGGDGMFGPSTVVKISNVTDGTSNTLFFGEQARFKNEPGNSQFSWVTLAAWWGDSTYFSGGSRITGGAYVVPRLNAPPDTTGVIQNACLFGNNTVVPPDWLKNAVPPAGPCIQFGQFGFHGLHPGGVNFAFADGSVKFLKESVSIPTYRALGTRAGGEVLSADSY